MHLYFLSSEDWILSVAWVSWLFAYSLRGRCQGAIVVILTSGSSVDKSTSKLTQVVGRITSYVCRTEVPVPCWLLVRGHSHLLEATAYFGSCLLITIFHTSRGEPSQASVPSDFSLLPHTSARSSVSQLGCFHCATLSMSKVQPTHKGRKQRHN